MNEWPEYFELDNVAEVDEAELSAPPKLQRSESVSDYLNKFDTRKQMESVRSSSVNTPMKSVNCSERESVNLNNILQERDDDAKSIGYLSQNGIS